MRSLTAPLNMNIKARKGPLMKNKNSFVFLCAIRIFSRLLFRALSLFSGSLFSARKWSTSFSSWLSLRVFLVTDQ